ncbi:MAG: hypothetical protein PHS86_01845 [Syntrophaceae bacterium]|nr:hypothetical protein [Syntrophaceae bacterium]
MTCMPIFPIERIPRKPVRWETVWVNENVIATGRSHKRKPVGEVWREKDGTYHVMTLARVGEEAAVQGPDIIREYLSSRS